MRIAVDATALPRQLGGAGNYIVRLVQGLARLNVEDEFLVFAKPEDLDRLGPLGRLEPVVVRVGSRPARLAWEQAGLPLALRRHRVELLHSPHYTLPLAAGGVKRVVTFHDLIFFLFPEYHQRSKLLFFRAMIRAAARLADHVITDSDSTTSDARRILALDPRRVSTVHLAADADYRPVDDPDLRARVDAKYGLRHPYVLTVCTLEPRKNLAAAVRALGRLVDGGLDARLAVVGARGWGYGPLFDEVRRLGLDDRIAFLGYAPRGDLPALFSSCDVFLYPSLYEGFGLPPLEAMACGALVITSNRSSLPEVVGDGGLQYDPEDGDTLTRLLSESLTRPDLRRAWRAKALAQASRFSWDATVRRTYDIYRSVARRAG